MSEPTIDLYSHDAYVEDTPWDQVAWLQQHAPVFRHPHPDGGFYWLLTRHADVAAVSRDHDAFSAERGFVLIDDLPEDILPMAQGQLLGMDPPNHGPIRRVVIERFNRKRLALLEPRIREIVGEIFDSAPAACNFVEDFAGLLPTAVICEMMGIPREMWQQIRHWADLQTSSSDPDVGGTDDEVQNASQSMGAYGYQLATERMGKGGEDLISLLINVEVEGHKVDEMQFASLFVQITTAGNETTRTLIAGGMHELLKNPALYRELEANPQAIPAAVEEMLRWTTPLHYFRRTATRNAEIAGQPVAEGDRVVMMYSAANRDPAVFDQPQVFDIRRDPNPHLSFGHGIHLCLGANLARLEARVFFEEFFRRFVSLEQTGEAARIRSNLINGLKRLPVRVHCR